MATDEPFTAPQRSALRKAPDTHVHPSIPSEPVGPVAFGTTADSVLRGKPEKTVDLVVSIPKSVRKELRSRAGSLDISVDELVTRLLRDGLT